MLLMKTFKLAKKVWYKAKVLIWVEPENRLKKVQISLPPSQRGHFSKFFLTVGVPNFCSWGHSRTIGVP